jgi:hypothetical protein
MVYKEVFSDIIIMKMEFVSVSETVPVSILRG